MSAVLAAAWAAGAAPVARAADPSITAPKLRSPKFPLEPSKKPALPEAPETYVAGATEPPADLTAQLVAPVAKSRSSAEETARTLKLGWFFASRTLDHSFLSNGGAFQGSFPVKTENGSPLGLQAELELWLGGLPWALTVRASGTTGNAQAVAAAPQLSAATVGEQELEGAIGVRWYGSERGRSGFSVGIEGSAWLGTALTLSPDHTLIDSDQRQLFAIVPRVAYRVFPRGARESWTAELSAAAALGVASAGGGDVRAENYRRYTLGIECMRYLADASALGMGADYDSESLTWSRTAPSILSDPVSGHEIRLRLFWSLEI